MKKNNKKTLGYSALSSIFLYFLLTSTASAQSLLNPESNCIASGNCSLDDMVGVLIVLSQIILGLVGSLSLLAFVYGGVVFIVSGGSSERVTKAKQIITGAVVGLAIVFTSYTIITFVFLAFDVEAAKGGKWATPSWATTLK